MCLSVDGQPARSCSGKLGQGTGGCGGMVKAEVIETESGQDRGSVGLGGGDMRVGC